MGYLYILGTIILTAYGQLIIKWRLNDYGVLPDGVIPKFSFLALLLLDPFILSGFIAAFFSSFAWMAALTKFNISYAYPFMSLSFVLVTIFSVSVFHEPVNFYKIFGLILIVSGIIVTTRSL